MSADIPSGIAEAFRKFESSDSQREDAVVVLASQCAMVGDVVILNATDEAIDSDKSRAWLQEHRPHLLPPIYERSLADRAFADNNLGARGELLKQVGMTEANRIAVEYGLKSASDPRRGKAPAADPVTAKKNGNADHSKNPWHRSNFNVTRQGQILKALGPEKAAALARAVGSTIGATRPNPNF